MQSITVLIFQCLIWFLHKLWHLSEFQRNLLKYWTTVENVTLWPPGLSVTMSVPLLNCTRGDGWTGPWGGMIVRLFDTAKFKGWSQTSVRNFWRTFTSKIFPFGSSLLHPIDVQIYNFSLNDLLIFTCIVKHVINIFQPYNYDAWDITMDVI